MRVERYADPRRRLERHRQAEQDDERLHVFREIDAVPVAAKITLTTERRRRADVSFNSLTWPGYKQDPKRRYWHRLYQSLLEAHCRGTAVMYCRRESSDIELQVIDAAVRSGYAREIRSKPGWSDHCSRLLPTDKLLGIELIDPWSVDTDAVNQFVYVCTRRDDDDNREEIPHDPDHPVAKEWQKKLELINRVNAQYTITYRSLDSSSLKEEIARRPLQLRPVHSAKFLLDFDHCGRLYTGKYGHQGLAKIERAMIAFDGEPSIELDYSGLHTRLLYHLEGIDYQGDPYRLWGIDTTDPMREMAKVYVNALINAATADSARDACNYKMCRKTTTGKLKTGNIYRTAIRLKDFANQTGIRFGDLYPLVMKKHHRIADQFGHDKGIKLMRIDAEIALNVMHHSASKSIPCLGVHDSFIVPERHEAELKETMLQQYHRKVGFLPKVKG